MLCRLGLPWGWLGIGAGVPAFPSGGPGVLPVCAPPCRSLGRVRGRWGRASCRPGPPLFRGDCVSGGRGAACQELCSWGRRHLWGSCCHVKTEAQLSPQPPRTPDPGAPSPLCLAPSTAETRSPGSPAPRLPLGHVVEKPNPGFQTWRMVAVAAGP
ncbi:unnamed protein product [Rangifer tarandus platyrhynchus]|uniref:Uncharacterized protein n=1 Tax=Rangifer tarandus platyrhynchus TaxID=3082113 RepID=A0ABN8ZML9_RANTA|nr:unnamed protein product [Rangifer tarandus platyrhynchus]